MRKISLISIILVVILSFSVLAFGENWPTWRGENMMGISANGNPPVKWSESENVKWKVGLKGDTSNSTPIIWGDKIFFHEAVDTSKKGEGIVEEQPDSNKKQRGRGGRGRGKKKPTNIFKFNVVCLDKNTGKEIWTRTVTEAVPHEGHHKDNGHASYSPITDGKLLWCNFGSRGLYSYDLDGNFKWKKTFPQMKIRAGFGEGNSPALAGDNLIVLMDQEGDSIIYAFNKETGKLAWKKDRDEATSWTSPVVLKVDGKLQVVVNGHKNVIGYDASNGDVIWKCTGQTQNVVPTPVANSEIVYCTSGFRGAMLQAIKLGNKGDLTGTDAIIWQVNEATPYVPSPVLYENKIYVCSGNKGIVSCYNAKTGKPYYTKQKMDEMKNIYASAIGASGRVYFVGRNGVTYVLKNSDSYEVLSVNKLDDTFDTSPAVVGNELFLKGKKSIYCIANSK